MNKNAIIVFIVIAALAFAAGYFGRDQFNNNDMAASSDMGNSDPGQRKILYWVAPMDANFRRDGPGKSPMGMDLVPVYEDEAGGNVVEIGPHIVNNLGVRTATVERGRLWRKIDTVGYVSYDENLISHVHLRTDGWIEKLHVKSEGTEVKQGDLLFEIYSPDLVNAQEEYLQALKSNNTYIKSASKDRLIALGVSSNQIERIAKSGKPSQRIAYYAKQDGIIDKLNIREGMFVKPASELMTLIDLSRVWIMIDVFERQADWLKVGQSAEVELVFQPGKILEGRVEFIYPSLNEKTRTVRARLAFDNPDQALKPEMYSEVTVYAGPKDDILIIPREALIRTGNMERLAVALGDGRFEVREVESGMESGDWVEILRGVKTGEKVVTSGQFLIDSEASIRGSILRLSSLEEKPVGTIFGSGTINAVMPDEHKINLSHEPIDELGWPAMTMNLPLTDNVDMTELNAGSSIHFSLVENEDGYYQIDSIHVME